MATLNPNQFNQKGNTKYAFVKFPDAKIFDNSKEGKWMTHLLFGDYVTIIDDTITDGKVQARSRNKTGWISADKLMKDRVLEVNFVDIGQGDGCHVVTPDDQHFIIDAGESDNMNRYLSWRFNIKTKSSPLEFPLHVIISHSDIDHYGGFSQIFDEKKFRIDKVFHNGIVERPGADRLGKVEKGYITGLVNNTAEMMAIIGDAANRKESKYCATLYKAYELNNDIEFKALSHDDEYLNGFDAANRVYGKVFSFKILAPIRTDVDGHKGLKDIKDTGKTKNGHSVVLKIIYENVRILLGGDVNEEFGEIIRNFYSSINSLSELQVDAAKACHHGSNHFDYGFIEAINAAATVISSGDNEEFCHPRPDTLGALGKCGYGKKPLIFSTELARSNKEIRFKDLPAINQKFIDVDKLKAELETITDPEKQKKTISKIDKINKDINSYITRYGMINLRTDGNKMIIAQKLEKDATWGKWDIHELIYSTFTKRFELQE